MVEIYSLYNRPAGDGVAFSKPSLTQQHFKDECDVNTIMSRYLKTGFLTDPLKPPTSRPMFGDFSSALDFHNAQTIIAEAQQTFDSLPSFIRDRFNNDPAQLLAFLGDEKNKDEAIKLGIISPTPEEAPAPSEPVSVPVSPQAKE
jgi:phage internal scaffolding protein